MFAFFLWWAMVELVGLVALPLSWLLFCRLPAAGYAFHKTFGLLLFGFIGWWLITLGVLPNTRWALLIVLVLLAAASVAALRLLGVRPGEPWVVLRRQVIVVEAIFFALLAGYAYVRRFSPEITGTEKFMDFMFINSILRATTFPPEDAWAAGLSINYYYFGHLMVAFLTRLSGIPSAVTFNLALALFFALSSLGGYGIAYSLTRAFLAAEKRAGQPERTSTLVGFLGVVLLMLSGNLFAIWKFFSDQDYLWQNFFFGVGWNSSRVVQREANGVLLDFTINEFPSFSFILGDLHPHVMSLAFALLAVGAALAWYVTPDYRLQLSPEKLMRTVLSGIIFGSLYFLNSWDFPSYFAVLALAVPVSLWQHGRLAEWKRALVWGVATGLCAVLFFAPFYLHFKPPASGLGLVPLRTQFGQFLLVFGLFFVPAVLSVTFIVSQDVVQRVTRVVQVARARGRKEKRQRRRELQLEKSGGNPGKHDAEVTITQLRVLRTPLLMAVGWLAGTLLLVLVAQTIAVLVFAVSLIAGIAVLLWYRRRPDPLAFALTLLAVAALLVLLTEIVYVRDFYGPPNHRMNTVFKVYYQVWALLAPATAFLIFYTSKGLGETQALLAWAYRGITGLLILGGLFYTLWSAPLYARTWRLPPTLDGTKFYELPRVNQPGHADEMRAIAWLQQHARNGERIVEAMGQPYSEYSRVSTFTGLPTVMGWRQHEQLWRNDFQLVASREQELKDFYSTHTRDQALQFLQKYGITYIFIGDWERKLYGAAVERLVDWFPVAFQSGSVYVLRAAS